MCPSLSAFALAFALAASRARAVSRKQVKRALRGVSGRAKPRAERSSSPRTTTRRPRDLRALLQEPAGVLETTRERMNLRGGSAGRWLFGWICKPARPHELHDPRYAPLQTSARASETLQQYPTSPPTPLSSPPARAKRRRREAHGASFVLYVVHRAKVHHDVLHHSPLLKKTCVRQVVSVKGPAPGARARVPREAPGLVRPALQGRLGALRGCRGALA